MSTLTATWPRLRPLDTVRLDALRDALVDAPLTYDEQGATASSLPRGYFHVEREWVWWV